MQHFPTIGKVLFFSQISPHFFIRNTEPHIRKNLMWGSFEQVTLLQKPIPQGERDKLAAPTAVEFLVDMFLMCVHCLDTEM